MGNREHSHRTTSRLTNAPHARARTWGKGTPTGSDDSALALTNSCAKSFIDWEMYPWRQIASRNAHDQQVIPQIEAGRMHDAIRFHWYLGTHTATCRSPNNSRMAPEMPWDPSDTYAARARPLEVLSRSGLAPSKSLGKSRPTSVPVTNPTAGCITLAARRSPAQSKLPRLRMGTARNTMSTPAHGMVQATPYNRTEATKLAPNPRI